MLITGVGPPPSVSLTITMVPDDIFADKTSADFLDPSEDPVWVLIHDEAGFVAAARADGTETLWAREFMDRPVLVHDGQLCTCTAQGLVAPLASSHRWVAALHMVDGAIARAFWMQSGVLQGDPVAGA